MNIIFHKKVVLFFAATIMLLAFLAVGAIEINKYVAQDKQLFRSSPHLQTSAFIAIGLAECWRYPVNPFKAISEQVENIGNSSTLLSIGPIDCHNAEFAVAVDMGFSWLLAIGHALTDGLPASVSIVLLAIKLFLVLTVFNILKIRYGSITGLLAVAVLGFCVIVFQIQMYEDRLILVNHNYNWIFYLSSVVLTGGVLYHKQLSKLFIACAVLLVIFLSLLRISDFYLLVASVICAQLMYSFSERSVGERKVVYRAVLFIFSVFFGHYLHDLYVSNKSTHSNYISKHSVIHPIVLGLGKPETPFSSKYGYKWGADSETLKVAKAINPNVTQMYSQSFNSALLQAYVNGWHEDPVMMLESYFIKIRSILDGAWWIYILCIFSLAFAMFSKDYFLVFYVVATLAKLAEIVIVYPTPYVPMFHQYVPAMLLLMGLMVLASASNVISKYVNSPKVITRVT